MKNDHRSEFSNWKLPYSILENSLRRSFFTFIYNPSSKMNYFMYTSHHSPNTSVVLHFRSLEADSRLLGILNEQYDDRDVLISEISKQVRDKCQQLNVYSCVILFSLISGGLCTLPLCRQHFRVPSALEVRSGNPKFNSLPYRSLHLFLGRPALFNSSATLVKS